MKYTMKAGVLYKNENMVARLKGSLSGPAKNIFLADGTQALRTDIREKEALDKAPGDVRFRQYIVLNENGKECVVAKPDYAEEDKPEHAGWPVCRLPRVDHAALFYHGEEYKLTMQSSQKYSLSEKSGNVVVLICHRGLKGGWNIEADEKFQPEMVCGIFALCRYMERENEFLVV